MGRREPDPYLDDAATERARAAILSLDEECRGMPVPEEHALLLLSETLSSSDVQKLLSRKTSRGEEYLRPEELSERLREVTGQPSRSYGVVDRIQTIYSQEHDFGVGLGSQDRKSRALDRVLKKVDEVRKKPELEKNLLRQDVDRRRNLVRLEEILEDPNLFEVGIDDQEIRFSNGTRRPILRRGKDGAIVVGVPFSQVLATQDYLNPSIVARHRADSSLQSIEFEGTWLPDGRVLILDQHHRVHAYLEKYGEPLPFSMKPSPDGRYRSSSHLFAMKFYTSWSSLSEKQKLELFEALEKIRSNTALSAEQKKQQIRESVEGLYRRTVRTRSVAGPGVE